MRNVEVHSATYPALIQTSVAAFWHAPLCFVSAQIFSADITGIYDRLRLPARMSHGVRGDFVDYRGKERFANRGGLDFVYQPELPVVYAPKPDVNRIKIGRLQCMHIGPHVERAVPP